MDHLFAHILKHKLIEFNAALALNTDRSVTLKVITQRDDFSEMKESKFIELCRAAKIISNDVRKILDQKLETRNSGAHPSGSEASLDSSFLSWVTSASRIGSDYRAMLAGHGDDDRPLRHWIVSTNQVRFDVASPYPPAVMRV